MCYSDHRYRKKSNFIIKKLGKKWSKLTHNSSSLFSDELDARFKVRELKRLDEVTGKNWINFYIKRLYSDVSVCCRIISVRKRRPFLMCVKKIDEGKREKKFLADRFVKN